MTGTEASWVPEVELHGYLDGELGASRVPAVERFLERDDEARARLEHYRWQSNMICRLYGPLLNRPMPDVLITEVAQPARPSAPPPPPAQPSAPPMAIVAVLGLVALGLGGGWLLDHALPRGGVEHPAGASYAGEALQAHQLYTVEEFRPVDVGVADADYLLLWLSRRLGVRIAAPDLRPEGFTLMGGRLLPGASGPAGQLMYQGVGSTRLTLYLRPIGEQAPSIDGFELVRERDLGALSWQLPGLALSLVAELPEGKLRSLATRIGQALRH